MLVWVQCIFFFLFVFGKINFYILTKKSRIKCWALFCVSDKLPSSSTHSHMEHQQTREQPPDFRSCKGNPGQSDSVLPLKRNRKGQMSVWGLFFFSPAFTGDRQTDMLARTCRRRSEHRSEKRGKYFLIPPFRLLRERKVVALSLDSACLGLLIGRS